MVAKNALAKSPRNALTLPKSPKNASPTKRGRDHLSQALSDAVRHNSGSKYSASYFRASCFQLHATFVFAIWWLFSQFLFLTKLFSKNQNIDSFNHVKFNFYFLNSNKTGRSPRTRSIFNLWKHPGRTESTARPRTNRSTARTLLTTLPSMPRQSFHLRRRTFFTKKFKFMAHLSFLF